MLVHLKRILIFLAIGAGVIVLLIFILFGKHERDSENRTWNKLKFGDSVYAYDFYLTDTASTQIPTYRKIRPINEADVNKMDIPDWKKAKLIAHLDTSAEHARPVMLGHTSLCEQDDMFKQKSAFIGVFLRSDSTSGRYGETIYIPLKWHVIKPNLKIFSPGYEGEHMPANYTYADSNIYVDIKLVQLKESKVFNKRKQ